MAFNGDWLSQWRMGIFDPPL